MKPQQPRNGFGPGRVWQIGWMLLLALPHSVRSENELAETKALEGTWKGWVVEGKGEKADTGAVRVQLVVKGDVIVATRIDGKKESPLGEGTFKLTLAKGLQTIDATRTSNPGKGQTYLGIYHLEGDTFRWCSATPGKDRPTELETRRGQFLMILKRQP